MDAYYERSIPWLVGVVGMDFKAMSVLAFCVTTNLAIWTQFIGELNKIQVFILRCYEVSYVGAGT